MNKITKANFVSENITLTSENKELQPLEVFMGKLGTENIQLLEDNIFELIKIGIDKFADGFQFTDLTAVISLYAPLKGINDSLPQAKKEFADLDAGEARANVEYISDNILQLFGVELDDNGILDTESLQFVIDKLFEAVKIVKTALADGLDIMDIKQVPELMAVMIDFALNIGDAIEEAEDLSGNEIGDVSREFAENVLYLVKN